MNIFYLDKSPVLAAQMLCDRHALNGKMAVEMGQMMANLFSPERLAQEDCPRTATGKITKHSYYNHPCSVWIRKSYGNFFWALMHGMAICQERKFRTGKDLNGTGAFLDWVFENMLELEFSNEIPTSPALCMPDEYKTDCPVKSYRNYYKIGKKHLLKYTKREAPKWI